MTSSEFVGILFLAGLVAGAVLWHLFQKHDGSDGGPPDIHGGAA